MRAACGIDELDGDAHAVAGEAHAAFEEVAYGELACDLADVEAASLVGEGRVARHDREGFEAAERGDEVFNAAVGEVVARGVAREIAEGQDGDAGFAAVGGCGGQRR